MFKKLFWFFVVMTPLVFSSCKTVSNSARDMNVSSVVYSAAMADLDVSNEKITYTYYPTAKVRRGGYKNCVNTAIRLALKKHGDADVLVETQKETVTVTNLLFWHKVKSVTVTGYPAKYKNFTPFDKKIMEERAIRSADCIDSDNQSKRSKILNVF